MTGADETLIERDTKQSAKVGYDTEITTRLRYMITEVEGDSKSDTIVEYAQNMLARDSINFRNHVRDISPDIDLTSEIEIGGEAVNVSIPLTVEFFWPQSL